MKKTLLNIAVSALFGLLGAYGFHALKNDSSEVNSDTNSKENLVENVNFKGLPASEELNFVEASKVSTPSVVFIKTISQYQRRSTWGMFFDFDPFGSIGKVSSSGSGVIMSKDGYIVTNYHVIRNADEITVNLNQKKRDYVANVIGIDPSTDLALLKIEGDKFPNITLGNSDDARIGDWVLAVGNPFNLTSTVTAGIVSAKGRNISIVDNQFPIESFIQTDAAINPGNSGGALVDMKGNLIGINTAIATKTGSYSGYGFAIPVNIVAKIVKDLIDFGEVQRGFTGMEVEDIDAKTQESLNTTLENGVLVIDVYKEGPASIAGVKEGDIITGIRGKAVNTKALYDEQLAYYRPGENIKVTLIRNGEELEMDLKLINKEGNTEIVKSNSVSSVKLGADFQVLSNYEMKKLGVSSGIKLTNIRNGLVRRMNLPDGFVITQFNDKSYTKPEGLIKAMENAGGKYKIEGVDSNGNKRYFNFYGY
jgi:serine protease Do